MKLLSKAIVVMTFISFISVGVAGVKQAAMAQVPTISQWAESPQVVSALKAENAAHAKLTKKELRSLARQWRSKKGKSRQSQVANNALSKHLVELVRRGDRKFRAIRVVDVTGLIAGESLSSKQYNQSRTAAWKNTVNKGKATVYIGRTKTNKKTGVQTIELAKSVVAPNGHNIIGMVSVILDAKQLAKSA